MNICMKMYMSDMLKLIIGFRRVIRQHLKNRSDNMKIIVFCP